MFMFDHMLWFCDIIDYNGIPVFHFALLISVDLQCGWLAASLILFHHRDNNAPTPCADFPKHPEFHFATIFPSWSYMQYSQTYITF